MSAVVLTEVVDRVGVITLNRPASRNAVNGALVAALHDAVDRMATDDTVRVVVLTGAASEGAHGGFCSGGDRNVGPADEEPMRLAVPPDALEGDLSRHDAQAAMRLHLMPKPTIAMVGGAAIGAGCSLAAACDLRLAADDAVFMAGFLARGLSGDYGGTFFWTRVAGTAVARRLYLLDEKFTAQQALGLGMVHEVVPAAELRERTMEVAARLATKPAALLAAVKDNLNQAEEDADRRRHLFANEAANAMASGVRLRERMAAKAAGQASGGSEPPSTSIT